MLQKYKDKRADGFTIIEVVIVLAIAGLIFAIVFVAVPQLQQTQRDQSRRDELGRVAAAVISEASNNSGVTPTAISGVTLPDDTQIAYNDTGNADVDVAVYTSGEDCDGAQPRAFKIETVLESGDTYCVDG